MADTDCPQLTSQTIVQKLYKNLVIINNSLTYIHQLASDMKPIDSQKNPHHFIDRSVQYVWQYQA